MTRLPARAPYASPRAVGVLLGSAAVTFVGDEVAAVALALAVHGAGGSGFLVAALLAAKMLPFVLLSPVSGWVVDRLGPARALSAASACAAVVVALTALTDSPWLWLVGTALVAAAGTVAQPALFALLPLAAGPLAQRRAQSWVAVANRSSALTGALLAGTLVAAGGLRLALLVDALTYLLVVLGVRLAAVRAAAPAPAGPAADRRVTAGFRLLAADPVLRVVLGVLLAAVVFVGISYVAVFFWVDEVLGGGPRATTAVLGAYGAGMTAGCWIAGRLPARALAPTAVRAPLLLGTGLLVPVLLPGLAVAVVGFCVAGLAAGTAFTALRGLVLERVPPGLLGRVSAAEAALGSSAELLALLAAGTAVTLAGPVAAMALCGAGTTAAGLLGVLLLRVGGPGATPDPVPLLPAPRAAAAGPVPLVPAPRAARDDDGSALRRPAWTAPV